MVEKNSGYIPYDMAKKSKLMKKHFILKKDENNSYF